MAVKITVEQIDNELSDEILFRYVNKDGATYDVPAADEAEAISILEKALSK